MLGEDAEADDNLIELGMDSIRLMQLTGGSAAAASRSASRSWRNVPRSPDGGSCSPRRARWRPRRARPRPPPTRPPAFRTRVTRPASSRTSRSRWR
ncbi:hypothetical protein LUX33_00490 [Actinomadura madurae]|uniref:phosphopantetheine-binding protein n=1 Tax=Actinomadura madurae TaxID=1993 RepID=UPI0020D213E0|nr:phosphopantetheine-binding protein [Actinomadura madurae]MCP9947086.1 hypothetical protein [Actinomadura madurae]MCQ0012186.1 hypothetical protein [Actinomadura madurae]